LIQLSIGKWRCKEVFRQNRKTCSLSHTRIGNAPLGLGVWEVSEIPDGTTSSLNFTSTGKGEGPEVDEVEDVKGELIKKCEALWEDRMLSRLAIPEVLETTLSKTDGMVRAFLLPSLAIYLPFSCFWRRSKAFFLGADDRVVALVVDFHI
jgi:hypothetical protein